MGARRSAVPALVLLVFIVAGCGSGSSNSSSNGQGNPNPLPTISSLSPSTVTAGAASTTLDVVGTGFVNASVLQWNGTSLTTTFTSATALSAKLPASDLADGMTVNVTVMNPSPGGGTSAVATFTVNNPVPAVTAVSPGSALAGSGDATLDLTGTGFVSSSVVNWNGTPLTTTFVSGTELKATLPLEDQAVASVSQITVTNPAPAGGSSPQVAFDVNNPVPTITALAPATATAGGAATTMTITGTKFVATSAILWNGTTVTSKFVGATEMQASLPAADLANGSTSQITAANPAPGGGTSASLTFTVNNPVPAIKAISPTSITAGAGATTLDITGTGFVPSSGIDWNGAVLKTTFVSGTEVTATLPAADTAGSSGGVIAAVNPAPAGGTSAAVGFNVNSPAAVITALTPANVEQGSGATTVTLTGTGFETNSAVSWNGQARPTTFVSSTGLQVALTATDLQSEGQGQLTVSNPAPNANTSLPAVLNITAIPVPVITGLTPPSIPANPAATSATTVVIAGTGFLPSALVEVNSQQIMTSAVSATSITVQLPASFVTTAGALSFVVLNPTGVPFSLVSSNTFVLNVIGAPVINFITPSAATLGSADLQISVAAAPIYPDSSVLWNGTTLATTYVSTGGVYGGPSLTATIPAADLATLQGGTITVSSPEDAPTTTSAGQVFSVYLPLQVNDLVINPVNGLLYASIPGAAGSMGNSVVGINPLTGAIVSQVSVGSEPTVMAISDDGTQLYVGLSGAGAVRQVNLTTNTAELQFSLGGGSGVYNPPFTAQGMAVLPGEPNSLAVYASNGVLTVYDSGVARPNNSSSYGLGIYFDENTGAIAFGSSASTLYALTSNFGEALYQLTIDSTGVTAATSLATVNGSAGTLQYDNGRLYLSNGTVLDATSGNLLGQFSINPTTAASGAIVSDSSLGRAWVIPTTLGSSLGEVLAFDESTFTPAGSFNFSGYDLNNPYGYNSNPPNLLRWGQNGLAFTSHTQVYSLQSPVVQDLTTSPADVSVAVSAPAAATTGTPLIYTITVNNAGPNTAQNIVMVSTATSGLQNVSATGTSSSPSTTITCGSTSQVSCTIPSLATGASATIQVSLTPISAGNFVSNASVYPVSYDPNTANNQAMATTVVSGAEYSPIPSVASLSPSLAQAGSDTLTLTVNGQDFDSGSVVNWNATALPTSLVSDTQLTAMVGKSLLTTLGWANVSVTNATPGGGTSGPLTFSIYQAVSLQANSIAFDPFTRKLYASIPSTATGVTGNSLVSVDPFTGAVGTPVSIGSEPNRLAETDDGNYMWIGVDGAASLAKFNLVTQTTEATVPINITQYGSTGSTTAQALAAQPGSDTTVAIETSNIGNIGIFDVTGNTGSFRTNLSGIYDGNIPVFGDATHLYAHDDYTSGNEFYAYSVDANGLTNIYGYTFFGFSEYYDSGFAIGADGLAYAPGGAIVNPANPPQQVALLPVTSSFGGEAVVPDTAQGFVFDVGGGNSPYGSNGISRFQLGTYVADASLPLPAPADGQSVSYTAVHFGQDGLALNVIPSYGDTSTVDSQILLFRGPFVLAAEAFANPAPVLTATSPTTIAVNSGNQYLTVTGTGFLPGAVVLWNGSQRTTTFVDAGHLRAAIPASDVAVAASVTLKADNPGSGDSNSLTVTLQ